MPAKWRILKTEGDMSHSKAILQAYVEIRTESPRARTSNQPEVEKFSVLTLFA